MYAEHPETGKICFFVDKCFPSGHSMSCALFQAFSDALDNILNFIVRQETIEDDQMTNYVDDFLFNALTELMCNFMLLQFIDLCE